MKPVAVMVRKVFHCERLQRLHLKSFRNELYSKNPAASSCWSFFIRLQLPLCNGSFIQNWREQFIYIYTNHSNIQYSGKSKYGLIYQQGLKDLNMHILFSVAIKTDPFRDNKMNGEQCVQGTIIKELYRENVKAAIHHLKK